jgi:imidazolonepropionase-like amidohydrolase
MQKARFQTKAAFENFPKSVAAGIKIAMGTDAGLSPKHGTNLTELTKFLDHGMTPMQAVVAGTRTGAELLRILDETGTVETGKRADLVVAKGDASVDLETVVRGLADTERNVLRVYKDGDLVISRTGL